MSQYIQIATPNERDYIRNRAIIRILSFLGEKYKKNHANILLKFKSEYKVGLDYINKKCRKGCKTVIRNLISSKRQITVFNADYRNWKFHRQKSERFFRVLYQELRKAGAPDDIWELFSILYADIAGSFPIDKRGSHIVSYPYHSALNQAKNGSQYNSEDQIIIARIESTFPLFDKFYRE